MTPHIFMLSGYNGIQRFMPVNYVQAHLDGLDNTVKKLEKNQPQGRATQFLVYYRSNSVPVDFYPLQPRGTAGFNFMIYADAGGGPAWGDGGVRRCIFDAYVNQKQQVCRTYATTPRLSS